MKIHIAANLKRFWIIWKTLSGKHWNYLENTWRTRGNSTYIGVCDIHHIDDQWGVKEAISITIWVHIFSHPILKKVKIYRETKQRQSIKCSRNESYSKSSRQMLEECVLCVLMSQRTFSAFFDFPCLMCIMGGDLLHSLVGKGNVASVIKSVMSILSKFSWDSMLLSVSIQ